MNHLNVDDNGSDARLMLGNSSNQTQAKVESELQVLHQHKLFLLQQQQQQQQESEYLKAIALRSCLESTSNQEALLGLDQFNEVGIRAAALGIDPIKLEMQRYKLAALHDELQLREHLQLHEQLFQRRQQEEEIAMAATRQQLQRRKLVSNMHHDFDEIMMHERLPMQHQGISNLPRGNIPGAPGFFEGHGLYRDGGPITPRSPLGHTLPVPVQAPFRNFTSTGIGKLPNCPNSSVTALNNTSSKNASHLRRLMSHNLNNPLATPLSSVPLRNHHLDKDRMVPKELFFKEEQARKEDALRLEQALLQQHTLRQKQTNFVNHLEGIRHRDLAIFDQQVRKEETEQARRREALLLDMHKREEAIRIRSQSNFQSMIMPEEQMCMINKDCAMKNDLVRLNHGIGLGKASRSKKQENQNKDKFLLSKIKSVSPNITSRKIVSEKKNENVKKNRKLKSKANLRSDSFGKEQSINSTQNLNNFCESKLTPPVKRLLQNSFSSVPEIKVPQIRLEETESDQTHDKKKLKKLNIPEPDVTDSKANRLRFFNNGVEVNVNGTPIKSEDSGISRKNKPNLMNMSEESRHVDKKGCVNDSTHHLVSYVIHRVPEAEKSLLSVECKLPNKKFENMQLTLVDQIIRELLLLIKNKTEDRFSKCDINYSKQNLRRRVLDCVKEIEAYKLGMPNALANFDGETYSLRLQKCTSNSFSKKSSNTSFTKGEQIDNSENSKRKMLKIETQDHEDEAPKRKTKNRLTTKSILNETMFCPSSSKLPSKILNGIQMNSAAGKLGMRTTFDPLNKLEEVYSASERSEVNPTTIDKVKPKSKVDEEKIKKETGKYSTREQEKTLSAANLLIDFMRKG